MKLVIKSIKVLKIKLFQLKSGCHYLILKIILEDPVTDDNQIVQKQENRKPFVDMIIYLGNHGVQEKQLKGFQ